MANLWGMDLLNVMVFMSIGVLIPIWEEDLGLTPLQAGLMGSAGFLGFGVMALPASIWLTRYNPKLVTLVCALGMAGVALIHAAAPNVAVLIVADSLWRKSRFERGLQELDLAVTSEEMEELREKYDKDDVLMPRILFKLGNTYQMEAANTTEGQEQAKDLLGRAIKVYELFRERFENDALWSQVSQAYDTALKNLDFGQPRQITTYRLIQFNLALFQKLHDCDRSDRFCHRGDSNDHI